MERRLVFEGGGSHKFWTVAVDGRDVTVHFGRVGTKGQVQVKPHPSPHAALDAAAKLVASKVAKGYVDDVGTAGPPTPPPAAVAVRARVAEVRPAAPPGATPGFDFDVALARLRRATSPGHLGWVFTEPAFAAEPTLEEAHFWLRALGDLAAESPQQAAANAAALGPQPPLSTEAALELAIESRMSSDEMMPLLLAVAEPVEVVAWLMRMPGPSDGDREAGGRWRLSRGVAVHLRPRLTPAQAEDARRIAFRGTQELPTNSTITARFVLAQLGDDSVLRGAMAGWGKGALRWARWLWVDQVLAVNDPALVASEWKRLEVGVPNAHFQLVRLVERLGTDAFPHVSRSVAAAKKPEADVLVAYLGGRVRSPMIAPLMLDFLSATKGARAAREWIDGNPGPAMAGLAPLLAHGGRRGEGALVELQRLYQAHGDALFDQALSDLGPDASSRVRARVTRRPGDELSDLTRDDLPAALAAALAWQQMRPAPGWLAAGVLPAIRVGAGKLSAGDVAVVVAGVTASNRSLAETLRGHADGTALDRFAWSLFEQWIGAGAPSKDGWALEGVGLLGGDGSALRLAELIRVWPGEHQSKRAFNGIAALIAIGTDTALGEISHIAEHVKFKGLRERAQDALLEVAAARHLTTDELYDRIVPTCGLDAQGGRLFDYGPRRFAFVMGTGQRFGVREVDAAGKPAGKMRAGLPPASAKDDAALVSGAKHEWDVLKKQLTRTVKEQADRLQKAMTRQRRWAASDFDRLIVRHPVQSHLARALVWGVWTGPRLHSTFRVTEDLSPASVGDDGYTLPEGAAVGVLHPLHIDAELRAAWGEVLDDYELIPPFPQLTRPVHVVGPEIAADDELRPSDLAGISSGALMAILSRRGWERVDDWELRFHTKRLAQSDLSAVVRCSPGISLGEVHTSGDQAITGVWFTADGTVDGPRTAVGRVDPVDLSEVLVDLYVLGTSGR